ncbi:hypothetical protein BU14_0188s0007 [Porphyra umbilicalis]|uniref:Uncharacterized protein n=1 Tax=Porphyra umbilicalis TaxID=2786 RepID=A0A1X6P6F6_PORUM|nr:hypothetical protein BU14_0188s0007 [Porphyra umbilicalis]|eukprot:OSX76489.1 hypothetical protein BU14_0188s0007 [Porphyra umbilicalis]
MPRARAAPRALSHHGYDSPHGRGAAVTHHGHDGPRGHEPPSAVVSAGRAAFVPGPAPPSRPRGGTGGGCTTRQRARGASGRSRPRRLTWCRPSATLARPYTGGRRLVASAGVSSRPRRAPAAPLKARGGVVGLPPPPAAAGVEQGGCDERLAPPRCCERRRAVIAAVAPVAVIGITAATSRHFPLSPSAPSARWRPRPTPQRTRPGGLPCWSYHPCPTRYGRRRPTTSSARLRRRAWCPSCGRTGTRWRTATRASSRGSSRSAASRSSMPFSVCLTRPSTGGQSVGSRYQTTRCLCSGCLGRARRSCTSCSRRIRSFWRPTRSKWRTPPRF